MDEYRPMDLSLMESVWWVFSKPLRRVLFIRVSRSCHTALDTRHQSCLNLKMDVPAPEIMVTFPIISDPHKAASIDWKTTPWILPSNLAICIKANKLFQWMLGNWWHKFDASTLCIRTCIRWGPQEVGRGRKDKYSRHWVIRS
ncbi:isoleucine--tRNA ligase, cytoplasmic-like [Quercus lobata]|uniref:isoleucine--tRNA ligase, cytoplasmic-like n=1 Tax=Quercus lobata TaxID=97700 RepID=UPI0012492DF4|nr:isoleucine--tRNA ligase, cytoplasmic-like [Quercus lobata]